MTYRLCLLLLGLYTQTCSAQSEPDTLYRRFTEAYARLDSHAVAALYTPDAVLLNLYDGSPPHSLSGTEEILRYFGTFFRTIAANGQRMELTFRITDRQAVGDHFLDNGYYRLANLRDGEDPIVTFGKFSTVVVPEAEGYRFQVDATTNADADAYREAHPINDP